MTPRISLIAAVAENDIIGNAGALPWRLSTDMRRFKSLTIGKPVIMGRKTAESLGVPLVDRTNIVISSTELADPGFVWVTSVEEALDVARAAIAEMGGDEIMIIGGGTTYAATIGLADRLYLTRVAASPEGDVSFPAIDEPGWREVSREAFPAGERDSHATTFIIYDKRDAAPA